MVGNTLSWQKDSREGKSTFNPGNRTHTTHNINSGGEDYSTELSSDLCAQAHKYKE